MGQQRFRNMSTVYATMLIESVWWNLNAHKYVFKTYEVMSSVFSKNFVFALSSVFAVSCRQFHL